MENSSSEENRPVTAENQPGPAQNQPMPGTYPMYQARPANPYILPGSILIAALLIAGSLVYLVHSGGPSGGSTPAPAPLENPVVAAAAQTSGRDVVLGKADAPVLVVEYGDYQCPYCGIYFSDVQPALIKQYVDSGKARFVFRNLAFLGQESIDAAAAAECSKDQGKFWEYHNALYTAEVADGQERNGNLTPDLFLKLADQVGIKNAAFTQCLNSKKYVSAVQDDSSAASAANVYSTPTTFVNGKKVVSLDANGNPIPDPQTGDTQSVGANAQPIFQAIEAALQGRN